MPADTADPNPALFSDSGPAPPGGRDYYALIKAVRKEYFVPVELPRTCTRVPHNRRMSFIHYMSI
jgi:hypothetical protein